LLRSLNMTPFPLVQSLLKTELHTGNLNAKSIWWNSRK
jgi:hypothetical protein